jgi:hypothetical protein
MILTVYKNSLTSLTIQEVSKDVDLFVCAEILPFAIPIQQIMTATKLGYLKSLSRSLRCATMEAVGKRGKNAE